jgi:hypothetical protein
MTPLYISITGLRVKSGFATMRFWWLTIPAMIQAKNAAGNISAVARAVDGTHHTLSVWRDKQSMLAYLRGGAHLKAMQNFKSLGSGSVYGCHADEAPSWETALKLLCEHGRVV